LPNSQKNLDIYSLFLGCFLDAFLFITGISFFSSATKPTKANFLTGDPPAVKLVVITYNLQNAEVSEYLMDEERLAALLEHVKNGDLDVPDALQQLKHFPYEDLGFAKLDHHRALRQGFPEVVFCQGKIPEHAVAAFKALASQHPRVLATRVRPHTARLILQEVPEAVYRPDAHVVYISRTPLEPRWGKISVITAGTADIPVAEEAALTAELLGNRVGRLYDVGVAGIHRLFPHLPDLEEASALIVLAGMDGALPSVIAGLVDKPVVAVPTSTGYGANFQGLAPLLTMLNSCASGVGVVNIDNGFGAAVLAHLITKSGGR
jgi:NCAIR mutase (PurE)-related protein